VTTTRFSDATWQENRQFVQAASAVCGKGCIYASPLMLRSNKRLIFVIEMNNSQNRILGIGLIKNHKPISQKYRVYSNNDYNRYMYLGQHRLDRDDIADQQFLEQLETFCFKGKGHHKRLRGITCIDEKRWQQAQATEEDATTTPPTSLVDRIRLEFNLHHQL
jgi:hypothetical protein